MRYVIKLNEYGKPTSIECAIGNITEPVRMRRHPASSRSQQHSVLDAEFSVAVHRLGRRRYLEACALTSRIRGKHNGSTIEITEQGIPDSPVDWNYNTNVIYLARRPLDKLGTRGFAIEDGQFIMRCAYCQRLISVPVGESGEQADKWSHCQIYQKVILLGPCITCACRTHWSCLLVQTTTMQMVELLKNRSEDFSEPSPAAASPPPISPTAEPSVQEPF